jgi:serine/threonine-protein kinase RsbW
MSNIGTTLFDFRISQNIAQLPELLDAIERVAEAHAWDDLFRAQVLLVVEELVVNVISYGSRDPDEGWIQIRLKHLPDGLSIMIADNGQAYDPFNSAPAPSLDLDLDDRPVGGLGVHFVREMTDIQTYIRADEENRVTLLKSWPHVA